MRRQLLPSLFFSVRLPTLAATFWRRHIKRTVVSGLPRKSPVSFVIFRLDSLGDVVLTTPLFRALKFAYPSSRCTVVVQPAYKALLATNPHIDEILTLPNIRPAWLPQGLRRLLSACAFYCTRLRTRHFDYAISPRWDTDEHLATFLCALSGASSRVGYSEKASPAKARLNRGFDAAFDICLPAGPVRHEILRNLAIAEAVGATACNARPELHVTEQDRKRASRLLAQLPQSARLVTLGIGAHSPGRRWPIERYARTLLRLELQHSVRVVILCSAGERAQAIELADLILHDPVIVCGVPLREVCAVLERCELFIGNDSGCAHLAAAMGCKTLVVSRHPGGGDPNHFNSPVRFAPQGRDVRVLQPALTLDGCTDGCRSPAPHCILQVSVEEVAAAAHGMLSGARVVAPEEFAARRLATLPPSLLNSHSAEALRAAIADLRGADMRPFA